MSETEKGIAERRSEEAFAEGPFLDPRQPFRDRLRQLRGDQPSAFAAALEYFEQRLIPQIAGGGDPIMEWVGYGRKLGELSGRGQTVAIDRTGRSRALQADFNGNELILYLPDDTSIPALAIAVPRQMAAPQRATYELLINRARALPDDPA